MGTEDTAQGDRADALVAAYVMDQYREEHPKRHKATCADASTSEVDKQDGQYGCDTGCEYARLSTEIVCPHEPAEDYDYGEFGDIAGIVEYLLSKDA